jgi:hypothetical protein
MKGNEYLSNNNPDNNRNLINQVKGEEGKLEHENFPQRKIFLYGEAESFFTIISHQIFIFSFKISSAD